MCLAKSFTAWHPLVNIFKPLKNKPWYYQYRETDATKQNLNIYMTETLHTVLLFTGFSKTMPHASAAMQFIRTADSEEAESQQQQLPQKLQ
jgi:hypothetical protein